MTPPPQPHLSCAEHLTSVGCQVSSQASASMPSGALRGFLLAVQRHCRRQAGLLTSSARQVEEVGDVGSGYRIESDLALSSDWLPPDAFSRTYEDCAVAVAMAIEGVDDPAIQEARVVDVAMGTVVWRSTEDEYE
jgi:hypothetical protein